MRNDPTIANARKALRIAQGNYDRAVKDTVGHGGSPMEWLSEQVEEAEVALKKLLDARKRRRAVLDGKGRADV